MKPKKNKSQLSLFSTVEEYLVLRRINAGNTLLRKTDIHRTDRNQTNFAIKHWTVSTSPRRTSTSKINVKLGHVGFFLYFRRADEFLHVRTFITIIRPSSTLTPFAEIKVVLKCLKMIFLPPKHFNNGQYVQFSAINSRPAASQTFPLPRNNVLNFRKTTMIDCGSMYGNIM